MEKYIKNYFLFILLIITIHTYSWAQKTTVLLYNENYNSPISIGSSVFMAEIADTYKSMQKGLMYRPRIGDNQAMLFVYPFPQPMNFWMKNMEIPLDILFFDQHRILQEIKANVVPCKSLDCPVYPAILDNNQFVVEIKAGQAEKLSIRIGDKLNGI